MIMHIYLAGCE